MRVLLDLNIWVDIAARPKMYPESLEVYRRLESDIHAICFPLSGFTTVHYLLSQIINQKAATDFMMLLKKRSVRLLSFTEREVLLAETLRFKDFEDACVAATAVMNRVDTIVTRNQGDFKNSPVVARTPKALLREL